MKYSEKRNVLSLLLKEERTAECLMSCGRLFQMSLGAKRRLPVVQRPYNHGPIYIYRAMVTML